MNPALLPRAVRSRFLEGVNGLTLHVLEGGFDDDRRPCIVLLHGFPEFSYSWRKLMPVLIDAGYHVVAPDLRGYGRTTTTGWRNAYDSDIAPFRLANIVRDILGLVWGLNRRDVAAVVGHDFGSAVAAWCAIVRPDIFRSVVLMSAPFAGTPSPAADRIRRTPFVGIEETLANLPRPRKHYWTYYASRRANADFMSCAQGIHSFLRAYFHIKSADWSGNAPFRLTSWSADELSKLPAYYVMDLDQGMPETVAKYIPSSAEIEACCWLTDEELNVYRETFTRTGFQGGLNWYRCGLDSQCNSDLELFSGRTIDVPSFFISGERDWGVYQSPGSFEAMQASACTQLLGCHLVQGAGHWVQQEKPADVSRIILEFLRKCDLFYSNESFA